MAWWQVGRRERAVQARERAVEARETVAGSYTDTLIQGLLAQAQGTVRGDPNATAAVEVAAGVWARALAAATVTPATSRTRAVTPSLLALVGREWMRVGEALFLLQVDARGLTLAPASTWDVWGESDESTWRYRLDVEGPSGNRTRTAYSAEVVHTRFAVDPRRPWKGLPPTLYASATARAAGQHGAAAGAGSWRPGGPHHPGARRCRRRGR